MRMSSSTALPSNPASITATEMDELAVKRLAMTSPAVPALQEHKKRGEFAAQQTTPVTGGNARHLRPAKREAVGEN